MRHYTPIDAGFAPDVAPACEDGVVELTFYFTGGGQATVPMPIRYAGHVAESIQSAVKACREFSDRETE